MDLMNSIAAGSMGVSASSLQRDVSLSLQKKTMDAQEVAMQGLLEMLPPQTSVIDTYA